MGWITDSITTGGRRNSIIMLEFYHVQDLGRNRTVRFWEASVQRSGEIDIDTKISTANSQHHLLFYYLSARHPYH